MQPAKNSAPVSLHPQKKRLPGFVIALLIFGVLKGWPLLWAQAQQIVIPPPAPAQSVVQEVIPEVTQSKKLSFDEKYKDWAIVMLLHEIRITVHDDWSYETYVHRKSLVQTKDGNVLGESPIFYNGDTETVRILRAVTITTDGKEHPPVKVQDLAVYGDGMYSDAKQMILSMPEVTPGSLIDLEYIKTTRRCPMPGAFWYIQHAEYPVPMKEQKILFRFPKSAGIQFRSFLESWKPDIREAKGETVYSWERRESGPDTEPEEELLPPPTVETVGDGLEFSSIKSWAGVSGWYDGLIRKNLRITPEIRKAAEKATKGKKSVRDKTRAALEYLQENFRYVSMAFGDYSMEPHPTDQVFRNKYGDCKDQSLLAKAMLEVVGIRADLCFFAREQSGNDPKEDLPLPDLYDHVLLKVYDPGQGDFYADPLLEGYDIGEFPLDYQGAYLFVITSGGGQFERMPAFGEKRLEESIVTTVEIRPDGSAVDDSEHWWNLSESIDFRAKAKAMSGEEKQKFFEYLNNELAGGGKVLEITWDGLDAKYGRIKTRERTDRPDQYSVKDGLIVIDIPALSRPDGWGAKERKNPVFCPVSALRRQVSTFKVPEGFETIHLPKGFDLDSGFFSIRRDIERNGNTIKITEVKRTRRVELPASEYPRLKEFYDKLPSRTEQRIILKKKENNPG